MLEILYKTKIFMQIYTSIFVYKLLITVVYNFLNIFTFLTVGKTVLVIHVFKLNVFFKYIQMYFNIS